ncbi:MAG: amino acid adenylation domain-containing protein [Ferruginibacter sp.]|nr:amino acid adenylation domain-containing protein [Ferruginibacter sp.]
MAEIYALKSQVAKVEYDPFTMGEIDRIVACTEPQVEILTACLLGGPEASLAFNESISLKFTGLLNRAAMNYAFRKLISRHESLRAAFIIKSLQVCFFKNLTIQLLWQDISGEEKPAKQLFVKDYIKQDSLHLFDLANGPLCKAGLIKLNDYEHYFVLTAHHIICDGWSLGIILQDLSKLYSSYVQDTMIDLPEAASFSRFAREQSKFLQSGGYRKIEQFWLDQYPGQIPALTLPTDFSRPRVRTYKSSRLDAALANNVVVGLKKMGTKAGCSLVTTLLAAFETYLYRLSGQDDIVIGLPAAGQSVTDNYRLVGHCVNLLPLRSNPSPLVSFSEHLVKRKSAIFDAYENQQLTFGSLLKKLAIVRDPSRIPLVPVVFNIDKGMDDKVSFYELTYQLSSNPRAYENFELFVNIAGNDNNLTVEWSYNTQLFKVETIERMAKGFEHLLETIIANPFILLGEIELLTKAEEQQLINSFNNTDINYKASVIELIEDQVEKYPADIALVFRDEQLSFKQLNERSNQLAHYLKSKGVGVDSIVPVFLERTTEMIIGILGILKAGAAYVPIDTEYPPQRIQYMLEDTGATLVVGCKKAAPMINSINRTIEVIVLDEEGELNDQLTNNLKVQVQPHHPAYIIYTSGSTGKPKGVIVEHASLLNYLLNSKASYVNNERRGAGSFIHLSYSFDASVTGIFMPLLAGKSIVIGSKKDVEVFEDHNLWKYAPYDFIKITPAHLPLMTDKLKGVNGSLLTNKLVIGGEALKTSHFDKIIDAGIDIEIINEYGPTEATVGCSIFCFHTIKDREKIKEGIPIGKPMDNVQMYILDGGNRLLPAGVKGEIGISGAGLAKGYLNRADLTSEKFIPNPFSTKKGSKLYKTGDAGHWLPDGNIAYLGRMDDQVKIRGYRIELGEIENTLEGIPGIKEAVVLCKHNKLNDPVLVAYIVTDVKGYDLKPTAYPKPSFLSKIKKEISLSIPPVSKGQISEWKKLAGLKLPAYMVPVHFEILPSLPLTTNGKVDRQALPEPAYNAVKGEEVPVKPTTANETFIAGIWVDLLGISGIGLSDNFFELGGHSLIAIEVMARIEKETGKKLPPSTLFQYSTISELAAALDDQSGIVKWKSLVPIKPNGNKDPLYIIHGGGLDVMVFNNIARYMDGDQPVYGVKAKGKDGDDETLDVIEEMAAFYISEIVQQNPAGPYALLGFSAGSVIAFEMAKQLMAMKKKVKILGIIDYYLDEPGNNSFLSKKMQKYTTDLFPWLTHVFKSMIQHPGKAFQYQVMCTKLRYITMLSRLGLDKKRKLEGFYLDIEQAMEKNEFALNNYVVAPLDIRVDLFSTEIKVYYLKDPGYLGWKPYALKGIKVHKIPGDHDDMLLPPNDRVFANQLQNVLNKL